MNKATTIIFVKSPDRGRVKSRLASAIGEDKALGLYRAFVTDILAAVKKAGHLPTIAFFPGDSGRTVAAWLGQDLRYMPQRGEDLGERMKNTFEETFSEGFERAVLIGSDIPDLSSALLNEAHLALGKYDAVIGPASDGGYYLIGFSKATFLPGIFHDPVWGSSSVFRETMMVFHKAGRLVHVLREWGDVDTFEDLRSLFLRNTAREFRDSLTMSLCKGVFGGQ